MGNASSESHTGVGLFYTPAHADSFHTDSAAVDAVHREVVALLVAGHDLVDSLAGWATKLVRSRWVGRK
jgi:hypothetical protein